MNKVSLKKSELCRRPLDSTIIDSEQKQLSPITKVLGSSFLGACANKLLFREVTIGERKVRLMRHLPMLGTLGYYWWGAVKHLLPKPVQCSRLSRENSLIYVPNGKTAGLLLRSDSPREYDEKYVHFNTMNSANRPTDYLRIIFVDFCGLYLASYLPPPIDCIFALFLQLWTVNNYYSYWPSILKLRPVFSRKGTLIPKLNNNQFKNKLEQMDKACKARTVIYKPFSNNCATVTSQLLIENLPQGMKKHIGHPFCFYTPLDALIRAHNVNAINAQLEPSNA